MKTEVIAVPLVRFGDKIRVRAGLLVLASQDIANSALQRALSERHSTVHTRIELDAVTKDGSALEFVIGRVDHQKVTGEPVVGGPDAFSPEIQDQP